MRRRECSVPLGVCPFLDWLFSTEDCLGKILYMQCSKSSHLLVSQALGLDLVVFGDGVTFPANWLPSISTVASAKAAVVDNHARPELLKALYVRRHTLSCRTMMLAYSAICMPGVGWLTGRLLSVPDEGTSGGGEDNKIEYILKFPEATLNMHTRREQNSR